MPGISSGPPTSASQYPNGIDGNHVIYTDNRKGQLDICIYTYWVTNAPLHSTSLTKDPSSVIAQLNQTATWTITLKNTGSLCDTLDPKAGS